MSLIKDSDGAVASDAAVIPLRWRVARRTAAIAGWFALALVSMLVLNLGPTDGIAAIPLDITVFVLVAVAWGQLARLVDYRWFDGFAIYVPIFNIIWTASIVWRLSYRISPAPHRNWPPAAERRPSQVDHLVTRIRALATRLRARRSPVG